jgi:acetyl esterase/lipase
MTIEGQQLSLFVLSPPPSSPKTAHPAILFFHGGGLVGGPLNQFERQAQYLVGHGLVAIQVQYRSEDAVGTNNVTPSLQDAASAMRWVRAHAANLFVDPNRIGSAGGSADGLLAVFVGMMDSKDDVRNDRSVPDRADIMALFNPVLDMGLGTCCTKHARADFKALSPLYFVRPGLPPTLVL